MSQLLCLSKLGKQISEENTVSMIKHGNMLHDFASSNTPNNLHTDTVLPFLHEEVSPRGLGVMVNITHLERGPGAL